MVEIFVPFVLILMSWNADDPQGTMRVSQSVYIDQATCMTAGEERQRLVKEQGGIGREFAWHCTAHQTEIEVYHPLSVSE